MSGDAVGAASHRQHRAHSGAGVGEGAGALGWACRAVAEPQCEEGPRGEGGAAGGIGARISPGFASQLKDERQQGAVLGEIRKIFWELGVFLESFGGRCKLWACWMFR